MTRRSPNCDWSKTATALDLSRNEIHDAGVEALKKLFGENASLRRHAASQPVGCSNRFLMIRTLPGEAACSCGCLLQAPYTTTTV